MIQLAEIQEAASFLEGRILRTPLVYSPTFSRLARCHVYLKLENLQETGSFKIRGASWKIQCVRGSIGKEGVVAASAGNHAQGVALAASRAGLHSTIVMPEWASISKQEATKNYGGAVILEGASIDESIARARELEKSGKVFIHPYDDRQIIAGQGTVALEILEALPNVDVIVVPVGGGGLISGIAAAAKALCPAVRVAGVQAAACPAARVSLDEGRRGSVQAQKSIADGIAVKQIGELPFEIIKEKVDQVVLAGEESIAAAVLSLLERKKVLAEGAGAVPAAAILAGALDLPEGGNVVLVISGGNMDSPLLDRVIRKGLSRNGRIMRFSVCLDDVPGALAALLSVVAQLKANVLQIYHNRGGGDLPIDVSSVDLELETRDVAHIAEIAGALRQAGYAIKIGESVNR
jgi:threonine dehydratase